MAIDFGQVKTSLQILALRNLDADKPVLVQRQKSAFPPNFVHSLDSTHMMMTALACQEAGLTFAGTYLGLLLNVLHIRIIKYLRLFTAFHL